jgi:hypothetical protein
MEKQVQITIKSVYGKDMIYPANALAENLTKLTGQKTFSNAQLQTIEAMGFSIVQIAKPFKLAA